MTNEQQVIINRALKSAAVMAATTDTNWRDYEQYKQALARQGIFDSTVLQRLAGALRL